MIESAEHRAHTATPTEARRWWADPLRVVLAVAILFAGSLAPTLLWLIPATAPYQQPGAPLGPSVALMVLSHVLAPIAVIVLVAGVARVDGRRRLGDLGLRWDRRALPGLAVGLAVGGLIVPAVALALTPTGLLRPVDPAAFAGVPLALILTVALSRAFLLQGFGEELAFRGYLQTTLQRSPEIAVLISGFSFAVLHLVSSGGQQGWVERFLYLLMPLGFGLVAGALRLVTGSFWAAVGVHGGFHVGMTTALFLGAGDGPWLWASLGLIWTGITAVLLVRYRRRA